MPQLLTILDAFVPYSWTNSGCDRWVAARPDMKLFGFDVFALASDGDMQAGTTTTAQHHAQLVWQVKRPNQLPVLHLCGRSSNP